MNMYQFDLLLKCIDKQLNFGDLIKKETGQTAKEFIQNKLIDTAKTEFFESEKTVNEIAYELGFKYTQHFSRQYMEKVGHSPSEFRGLN